MRKKFGSIRNNITGCIAAGKLFQKIQINKIITKESIITTILDISKINENDINLIHNALSSGILIGYPTDTIFGLGVDVFNHQAGDKLFQIKNRDPKNPVSVLYSSKKQVYKHFPNLNEFQKRIIEKLLPGQVTLLLPLPENHELPPYFHKDGFTGVRLIDHKAMNNILANYENPISTTSINPSGEKPANSIKEILNYFNDQIEIIINDEISPQAEPSTILKVGRKNYTILRQGAVAKDEIKSRINSD